MGRARGVNVEKKRAAWTSEVGVRIARICQDYYCIRREASTGKTLEHRLLRPGHSTLSSTSTSSCRPSIILGLGDRAPADIAASNAAAPSATQTKLYTTPPRRAPVPLKGSVTSRVGDLARWRGADPGPSLEPSKKGDSSFPRVGGAVPSLRSIRSIRRSSGRRWAGRGTPTREAHTGDEGANRGVWPLNVVRASVDGGPLSGGVAHELGDCTSGGLAVPWLLP
jgi:hypothetical protein